MNIGTTVIINQSTLIFIDLGTGISFSEKSELIDIHHNLISKDFSLYYDIIKENIDNLKRIIIFFTHAHKDHRCGINKFLRFYTQFFEDKVKVILFLYQTEDHRDHINKFGYYTNNFLKKLIKYQDNAIKPHFKNLSKYTNVQYERNLEADDIEIYIFSKLNEINKKEPILIIPNLLFTNLKKYKIVLESSILGYSLPYENLNEPNIEFKNLIEFKNSFFSDDDLKIEFFNDKSHSFDHVIFLLEFKKLNYYFIHLGDIFPFQFALNDNILSNHENLITCIEKILNCINKIDEKYTLCVTFSHMYKYKSINIPKNTINRNIIGVIIKNLRDFISEFKSIKNGDETKLGMQKSYIENMTKGEYSHFLNEIENMINIFS